MRGRNPTVGYTSTKLHFANSWVHKPLKYTPLAVYVRNSETAHGHCPGGFVFKRATHRFRCSSAGGYQTALFYCGRPLLYWGWIACISRKASCTEPRGTEPWRFRTNTSTVPPLIYIYIYIYIHLLMGEKIFDLYCKVMESGCHIRQICSSQSNHCKNTPPVPRFEFTASHTGVSYITSTRGMFALFNRHTSNENDPWLSERLLLPESCGGLPKTVFLQRIRTCHFWKMELRCVSVAALGAARL